LGDALSTEVSEADQANYRFGSQIFQVASYWVSGVAAKFRFRNQIFLVRRAD